MAFGKPLGTASWSNRTEGKNGAGASAAEALSGEGGGMTRPRKRKSQQVLNKKTYRYESLDTGS